MSKHIGLYGGTFDPPHKGHLNIVDHVLYSMCHDVDEVWVIPTGPNPLKPDASHPSYRYQMCRMAWKNHTRVKVLDFESASAAPSNTYTRLEILRALNPDYKFSLILGREESNDITQWYRYEDWINTVDLIYVDRSGYSSTDIRKRFKEGLYVGDMITAEVAIMAYIFQLYGINYDTLFS